MTASATAQQLFLRLPAGCARAIAPGHPYRDVCLSPDHVVFVDHALIPARYLINGRMIVQEFVRP
jgi:hypothetical protein